MQLATIRIQDTEILSLSCPRLDALAGFKLLELVAASKKRGANTVVLDLGPNTVIDFAGARAVEAASRHVGDGRLFLAGLNSRARALLRAVRVTEHVQLVEWWTDAMEPAPMSTAA
ncbi:MAG: hypothetical protein JWP97_970 [Labilithrix sp.]|nr:hypothetical protein [Labilithrix sp.]